MARVSSGVARYNGWKDLVDESGAIWALPRGVRYEILDFSPRI
jgi:hypothetical protein